MGLYSISPFTHGEDDAAPVGGSGERVGKFTHPSAAPANDLLVVWTPGPANDLNRPTPMPYYDAGLYVVPGGDIVNDPADLVMIKNDPAYNEAWPRAVVSYQAVHGVAEPQKPAWLPNDGSVSSELPAGTPYGLTGTSSFYKRESFPGFVRNDTFDGLDAFNTSQNGQSYNWGTQGSDAGKYQNSDIWAVRVVAMEPGTHRSYGPNGGPSGGQLFSSHASERLRILGEIPLRKKDGLGNDIIDPEGNPDTSFLAKITADTPFTFQMLDRNGMALTVSQTWHQVRPGELRADCGGCHSHSQQPLPFSQTEAGQSGFLPVDLVTETPLVTHDGNGMPNLRIDPATVVDVEFYRDIRPLLARSCAGCHTTAAAPGNLILDDTTVTGNLPRDYVVLAADANATGGYPPVITNGTWRQTNASRYVRKFQSRRSLLMWKLFGQRLDGWANAEHPTESTPGDPATLPPGADRNEADLDYSGTIMPPTGSGYPDLTIDEKMLFARWIDLGCPINFGGGGNTPWGWFLDEVKPTVDVSLPRPGLNPSPVDRIRVGIADAHGLAPNTFSITTDFATNTRGVGAELVDLAVGVDDGVFVINLVPPIVGPFDGHVLASVEDLEGNITRVDRHFFVDCGGADTDLDGWADSCDNCPAVANPNQNNNDGDAEGDLCDLDDDNDGTDDTADCNAFDDQVWSRPDEITILGTPSNQFSWMRPSNKGGVAEPVFDVFRFTDKEELTTPREHVVRRHRSLHQRSDSTAAGLLLPRACREQLWRDPGE